MALIVDFGISEFQNIRISDVRIQSGWRGLKSYRIEACGRGKTEKPNRIRGLIRERKLSNRCVENEKRDHWGASMHKRFRGFESLILRHGFRRTESWLSGSFALRTGRWGAALCSPLKRQPNTQPNRGAICYTWKHEERIVVSFVFGVHVFPWRCRDGVWRGCVGGGVRGPARRVAAAHVVALDGQQHLACGHHEGPGGDGADLQN